MGNKKKSVVKGKSATTKVARERATKVTRVKEGSSITNVARKQTSSGQQRSKKTTSGVYTYDTKISVLERDFDFKTGSPPDMKLGDFFREGGMDFAADLLRF